MFPARPCRKTKKTKNLFSIQEIKSNFHVTKLYNILFMNAYETCRRCPHRSNKKNTFQLIPNSRVTKAVVCAVTHPRMWRVDGIKPANYNCAAPAFLFSIPASLFSCRPLSPTGICSQRNSLYFCLSFPYQSFSF